MSLASVLEHASETVQKAVERDNARDYEAAFELYNQTRMSCPVPTPALLQQAYTDRPDATVEWLLLALYSEFT